MIDLTSFPQRPLSLLGLTASPAQHHRLKHQKWIILISLLRRILMRKAAGSHLGNFVKSQKRTEINIKFRSRQTMRLISAYSLSCLKRIIISCNKGERTSKLYLRRSFFSSSSIHQLSLIHPITLGAATATELMATYRGEHGLSNRSWVGLQPSFYCAWAWLAWFYSG